MDALRIKEFFFKSNNELPNSNVSIKEDSSLLICNQFCLECSGEWLFYQQIRDSGEKSEALIRYPYHSCQEDYYSFENCDWIMFT